MIRTLFCLLTMLASGAAVAGEQSPEFMLDPGTHVAAIPRIAVHAEGGYVVTGSSDRSLRYWSLEDGKAFSVLRPPVGEGRAGQITAVEMLPSGSVVFAAEAPGEPDASSLYIVNQPEGRIFLKIGPYPGVVDGMAYLAGTRSLAMSMGPQGLILIDRSQKEVWRLAEAGRRSVWAEAGPDGLLAIATATESTGRIDIVHVTAAAPPATQPKVATVVVFPTRESRIPGSVTVSPDGREIAVGYASPDAPFVDVHALPSGKFLRRLSVANAAQGGGNLSRVAWGGAPGTRGMLYAGGTLTIEGGNAVASWRGGDGAGFAQPVARDSISHIAVMADETAVFASTFPSWGRLKTNAIERAALRGMKRPTVGTIPEVSFERTSPKLDMRYTGRPDGLQLSADGMVVRVEPNRSDQMASRSPMTFDFGRLEIARPDQRPQADLTGPRAKRGDLIVSGLLEGEPLVNGKPILMRDGRRMLGAGERALSADVAPDGGATLVGADFSLSLVDRQGRVLAQRALSSAAWSVAIARSGRLAVAALGDGTIRWYALTDADLLDEIAAVFVTSDRERWVAWRQDGYFAHAAFGGAELGGYLLNREPGADGGKGTSYAGRWISMAELYRPLYRADAVATVLQTPEIWREVADRRELDAVLASSAAAEIDADVLCPQDLHSSCASLRLVKAPRGSPPTAPGSPIRVDWTHGADATVDLVADERGGTVASVHLYRNGRLAGLFERSALAQDETADGIRLSVPVVLGAGTNSLSVRAYNHSGTYTEIEVATVERPPEPTPRTLHVLAIGIADYQAEAFRLRAAATDARDVASLLYDNASRNYEDVSEPEIILDRDATRPAILAAIERVAARAQANDTVVVYLAGHGETVARGYTFLPVEVAALTAIEDQGLSGHALLSALSTIRSDGMMVLIDTCYADAIDKDRLSVMAHDMQSYFLMAAADNEKAQDLAPDSQNGVFADALLRGLRGEAALASGEVDALTLGLYLTEQIQPRQDGGQTVIFRAGQDRLSALPLTTVRR